MTDTIRAILFAIEQNQIKMPDGKMLIFGAHAQDLCEHFPTADYMSYFAGDKGNTQTPQTYSTIIMLTPQQKDSVLFMLATCFAHLQAGGLLMVAASNDTGGKNLPAHLARFGCTTSDIYKHKCRVVWTTHPPESAAVDVYMQVGDIQQRADGLWTQAGVFCWDRPDKGSSLLKSYIPSDLTGHIADFGAGIGDLGLDVVQKNSDILSLTSIDHDSRALACAAKNLATLGTRHTLLWSDIGDITCTAQFDAIVMNPPFHDGKTIHFGLGEIFITKAATALKKKGCLYMVSNAQLAYERVLETHFTAWEELIRSNGFKIIKATR
ncbi:MAG: methyltransferase [Pseudomonadota bacterium]